MVSIESRVNYLSRLNDSPKLAAFNNLLLNENFTVPHGINFNESDEIYFGLINAIHNKDKASFENYYNKKNKSHPSKESPSPFVNDDFLIFSLVVGILKFGLDKVWIKNILSLRSRSEITITLENLLNENYFSKSNIFEIVLMYFKLNNIELITNELLNDTYKSIKKNTALFENKSDFQILCSLHSYDLVVELKNISNTGETQFHREFEAKFLKRVNVLSIVVYNSLLLFLLYALSKTFHHLPQAFKDQVNELALIIGIGGVGIIGGNFISNLRIKFKNKVLGLFGYNDQKIYQIRSKENEKLNLTRNGKS